MISVSILEEAELSISPAVLSIKTDASCAGLMANLFWYDVENGVLQCIQTVTVGGAFERSIPYADFTLSKGQDLFHSIWYRIPQLAELFTQTEVSQMKTVHTCDLPTQRFPATPLTETSLLSNFPKDVQVLRVMTS